MADKYQSSIMRENKLKYKIDQLQIELNLEKNNRKKLRKEIQNKIDIILRLNNIIRECKNNNTNLPVAIPIN